MVPCIYSSDGGGLVAVPELEVSCVTGLPARTARPFVPSFFAIELQHELHLHNPVLRHFQSPLDWVYNRLERTDHEDPYQSPLNPGFGSLRHHGGQLRPVVESSRRRSRLPPLRAAKSQRPPPDPGGQQANRRTVPFSLADPCLPAGDQDRERSLSASLQLPLRPLPGSHQPAQLL